MPTNAQLKIGRALELFNTSEHPRTVAGLARTLGAPHAGAATSTASAAEVVLTVAWELSWYQFNVDLSDGRDPVRLRGQGHELSELPERRAGLELRDGGRTGRSRSRSPRRGGAAAGPVAGKRWRGGGAPLIVAKDSP